MMDLKRKNNHLPPGEWELSSSVLRAYALWMSDSPDTVTITREIAIPITNVTSFGCAIIPYAILSFIDTIKEYTRCRIRLDKILYYKS
jgi:hypothetical protein